MSHHLAPVLDAMRFALPDMERMWNILLPQRRAESAIRPDKRVFLANDQGDLHAPQMRQNGGILKARNEVTGGVKIDHLDC